MKKIIILFFIIITFNNAYSQFEKGSKWIAGNGRINIESSSYFYSYDESKNSLIDFFILPTYSYFKSEMKMNSYFVGYSWGNSKSENSTSILNRKSNGAQIGFSKSSIHKLTGNVYSAFITSYYGYYSNLEEENISKSTQKAILSNSKAYSMNINLGLGLIYRVNNRYAISTTINNILYGRLLYSDGKNGINSTSENSFKSLHVDGGLGLENFTVGSIQIGLMYRLGKK